MKEKETSSSSKTQWKKFLNLIQLNKLPKSLIVLVLGLSLISTIAGLIVPWFTKDAVNVMTTGSLTISTVLLLVGAILIQAVMSSFATYNLAYLGGIVVANLRKKIWAKTLMLPIPYFDKNQSGETVSRINNDTQIIRELISNQLVSMFTGVVSLVGSLCILFYLDWSMTLVMLIAIPIIVFVMRPIGMKMRGVSKGIQEKTAVFTSLLTQVVSEIRLVKAYTAEPVEQKQGEKEIDHLFQYGLKESKIIAILQPLTGLIMMSMLVMIIGYGGMRVASGDLTAGELVAFILYLFQIIIPVTTMTQFFVGLQKAMGATERIAEILDNETEGMDQKEQTAKVNPQLPIHVENLSFAYEGKETILHNLNFTIEPGKVTALVGPSGSGKTTFFSLMERFYTPTSGVIRLGEHSIPEFSLRDWRMGISYVSQESPLLAGTIRDNICYAMTREVSEEELLRAAKLAYADEFILDLPDGFETEVGERGIKLSGGQRQRIAIARAILHDPKILMLDEATSNLDSASEQVVQEALQNLMKDRTTLVIAHRLSTVVDADQIVVLEKGKLTGTGTHEELLASNALYQQLVQQQFKVELAS
ncbi:ABC transporter transmembrane domain-containing protein [Shimazuella alba]|uniref:ATP-binding cassette domain-containing protein n=1 Tax=Shimazuella alba TaxID=2690964 RepID=A0A6I4VRW7_9BACL|nr:ATP-binding cassette domain-containing protein [Shimazuella alba]